LKRGLSAVTDAEWENLPEVGNLTGKKRKRDPREGRTYVVPDSVLVGDRDRGDIENSLDPRQQAFGGLETPADGALTNLVEIGQARDNLLSLKLDQVRFSIRNVTRRLETDRTIKVSNQGTSTSIDPKGYLTDLNSVVLKTEAEIGYVLL
jgi:pre-mRNA-processing factor 6